MSGLRVFLANVDHASRKSAAYSERHFVLFGYLAWCIPLATLIDYSVGNPYYDTLYVRLSVSILALPLIFYPKLSGVFSEKHYIYFSFITTYAFPYCYAHMLVMNAASAPPGAEIHMLWIFQYIIALFLFIQLINNGTLAVLLWMLASVLALAPIPLIKGANYVELQRVIVFPVSGYLTALLFGILTNRNIDIVNTEKIRTAAAIGSNIAHELRTPIAELRSEAEAQSSQRQDPRPRGVGDTGGLDGEQVRQKSRHHSREALERRPAVGIGRRERPDRLGRGGRRPGRWRRGRRVDARCG